LNPDTKKVALAGSWLLCVFYPFKGIVGALIYYTTGISGVSNYFIPMLAALAVGFVLLTFLMYGGRMSRGEAIFGAIGSLLLVVAFIRHDLYYARIVFLVFILPFILAPMAYAADKFVKRTLAVFFLLIAIYGAGEHVLFHTHLYGITDDILVSSEQVLQYYTLTGYQRDAEDIRDGNLIDWRQFTPYGAGGRLRTGGFLGQIYQMGALFALASIFFYVWWRCSKRKLLLFPLALAVFSLLNCVSTTAIISFCISVLFYEFYFNRGVLKFIIPLFFAGLVAFAALNPTPIAFLYQRIMTYPKDSLAAFLPNKYGNMSGMSAKSVVARFAIGEHGWWQKGNRFYAENDISNFVTAFGAILAFFIFKRFLKPVFVAKKIGHENAIIYSMVVFTAVIAMMHDGTITTPNIYPLIVLLNLKSYRLIHMNNLIS